MYARAKRDRRSFGVLKGREEDVKKRLKNNEHPRQVAEVHGVSFSTIRAFIEAHDIKLSASDLPEVAHLPETSLYKISNNLIDRNCDYVIKRRGRKPKVYIDLDEYVDLKRRAEHAKKMADVGASAAIVNGLLSSAD